MSLRLSVCSTTSCQLCSRAFGGEVCPSAAAIEFSISRDDFARDAIATVLSRRRNLTRSPGLSTCPVVRRRRHLDLSRRAFGTGHLEMSYTSENVFPAGTRTADLREFIVSLGYKKLNGWTRFKNVRARTHKICRRQ